MRKMYIIGPKSHGDGVYDLLLDDGEHLASHMCSNSRFAMFDLATNRMERLIEWNERFGEFDILYLGDDDMTLEKMLELNKSNPSNR